MSLSGRVFPAGISTGQTVPAMDYGIMPTGSVTIRMEEDVLGGKTVYKQYNMALYARGWTVDDVVRLENSTFLEDFADWVEEQQMAGETPKVWG